MSTITDTQAFDYQMVADKYQLEGEPAQNYVRKVVQNSFYSKKDEIAYQSMLRIIPVEKVTSCTLFKGGLDIEFESAMTSQVATQALKKCMFYTPKTLKVVVEQETAKMIFPDSYSALWVKVKYIPITLCSIVYDNKTDQVTLEGKTCGLKKSHTISLQQIQEFSEQYQFN